MKFRIALIAFLLVGFPLSDALAEVKAPGYTLKLSKDRVAQDTAEQFDCRERVYLLTTWYKVFGPHRVTAQWFNPEGTLQDEGHLDFVGQQNKTDGWLGLEFLNVDQQAASEHLNAEAAKFYGQWKVKVFLDSQFLEEREFFVRCK